MSGKSGNMPDGAEGVVIPGPSASSVPGARTPVAQVKVDGPTVSVECVASAPVLGHGSGGVTSVPLGRTDLGDPDVRVTGVGADAAGGKAVVRRWRKAVRAEHVSMRRGSGWLVRSSKVAYTRNDTDGRTVMTPSKVMGRSYVNVVAGQPPMWKTVTGLVFCLLVFMWLPVVTAYRAVDESTGESTWMVKPFFGIIGITAGFILLVAFCFWMLWVMDRVLTESRVHRVDGRFSLTGRYLLVDPGVRCTRWPGSGVTGAELHRKLDHLGSMICRTGSTEWSSMRTVYPVMTEAEMWRNHWVALRGYRVAVDRYLRLCDAAASPGAVLSADDFAVEILTINDLVNALLVVIGGETSEMSAGPSARTLTPKKTRRALAYGTLPFRPAPMAGAAYGGPVRAYGLDATGLDAVDLRPSPVTVVTVGVDGAEAIGSTDNTDAVNTGVTEGGDDDGSSALR